MADAPFRVVGRVIRLEHPREGQKPEYTVWPFPFSNPDLHQCPAWKARYAPGTLTQTDLFELAEIANAYSTLITHPSSGHRATIHRIHRAWKKWCES